MTLSTFRARFGQFADATLYTDEALDLVLQEASRSINASFFGARADDAHGYLAAHLALATLLSNQALAVALSGVKSISAGTVSVSYGEGAIASASDFSTTPYGQLYLRILRLSGGVRAVVI